MKLNTAGKLTFAKLISRLHMVYVNTEYKVFKVQRRGQSLLCPLENPENLLQVSPPAVLMNKESLEVIKWVL